MRTKKVQWAGQRSVSLKAETWRGFLTNNMAKFYALNQFDFRIQYKLPWNESKNDLFSVSYTWLYLIYTFNTHSSCFTGQVGYRNTKIYTWPYLDKNLIQLPFIGEIPGYYYVVHMWMKTVNIFLIDFVCQNWPKSLI